VSQSPHSGDPTIASDASLAELCRKSECERYGISHEAFAVILHEIRLRYLPAEASSAEIRVFYASLRVEELAIARACAAGNERAWEVFLIRYRARLYEIAGYIAKESSAARDLADCLYADLYGTGLREGQRVSKLNSYTGRGSLEGWLRTVMAQEFVNRYRKERRLVSLDEESEEGAQFAVAEPEPAVTVDPRLEAATDEALAALPPEDRFVLASYYLDDRTLAEIARMLRVHESTISRKLDKLAKLLRKNILAALGRRGMSRRQAQEALEVDVRDLQLNIRRHLAQETGVRPFPDKKANVEAGDGSG
jgi:RNA polymerase sigma-70 factor (ECF subfamily)